MEMTKLWFYEGTVVLGVKDNISSNTIPRFGPAKSEDKRNREICFYQDNMLFYDNLGFRQVFGRDMPII